MLRIINPTITFFRKTAILKSNTPKTAETKFMCNPHAPKFPYWIDGYKTTDPVEGQLLQYFRQLFQYDLESKEYHRALSKILNTLISKKLLILPDTNKANKDYGKAIEQNLNWLRRPLIIITPEIRSFLEDFCLTFPNHQYNTIKEGLNNHLTTFKKEDVYSTKYREAKNYLSNGIEKLLDKLIFDVAIEYYQQNPQKKTAIINGFSKVLTRHLKKFDNFTQAQINYFVEHYKECLNKKQLIEKLTSVILAVYYHHHSQKTEIVKRLTVHINNFHKQVIKSPRYEVVNNYLNPLDVQNILNDFLEGIINNPASQIVVLLNNLKDLITYQRRIQLFDPNNLPAQVRPEEGVYLKEGLPIWIKDNLRMRISDLYNPNRQPQGIEVIPIEIEGRNIDTNPDIATPAPSIEDLDNLDFYQTTENLNQETPAISNNEAKDLQKIIILIKDYLSTDPHQYLASRSITGYPECTYKILAGYFLNNGENKELDQVKFVFPHGVKKEIVETYKIPYQKLVSGDLLRHFIPFVASLTLRLGLDMIIIKQAIEDQQETLIKCQKKSRGIIIYNAYSLALELLPMFNDGETIVNSVIDYLNSKGYNLNIENQTFDYNAPYYLIFQQITEEINRQTRQKCSLYDVQRYWEYSVIEKINQRIFTENNITVTLEEILEFWQIKCLPRLGKIMIKLMNKIKLQGGK